MFRQGVVKQFGQKDGKMRGLFQVDFDGFVEDQVRKRCHPPNAVLQLSSPKAIKTTVVNAVHQCVEKLDLWSRERENQHVVGKGKTSHWNCYGVHWAFDSDAAGKRFLLPQAEKENWDTYLQADPVSSEYPLRRCMPHEITVKVVRNAPAQPLGLDLEVVSPAAVSSSQTPHLQPHHGCCNGEVRVRGIVETDQYGNTFPAAASGQIGVGDILLGINEQVVGCRCGRQKHDAIDGNKGLQWIPGFLQNVALDLSLHLRVAERVSHTLPEIPMSPVPTNASAFGLLRACGTPLSPPLEFVSPQKLLNTALSPRAAFDRSSLEFEGLPNIQDNLDEFTWLCDRERSDDGRFVMDENEEESLSSCEPDHSLL
jgi:hypothetical protein